MTEEPRPAQNASRGPCVTVIVVNWNGARVLPRCLDALAAQTRPADELIVVDNGSTDGSADGLEERWPGWRVIRLSQNTGFAAANNLAARQAAGDWLALVNTDAFLAPDWLAIMLDAAGSRREYSFFACQLRQHEDPALLDGAGDVYHVSGLAWRRGYGRPLAEYSSTEEVFAPCAAAALYSREAFLAAGGFDENLFSYYEDVDLGYRLRLAGHRCLYVPGAVARHVGAATHGKLSDTAIYLTHRNLEWTFVQNAPASLLLRELPGHLVMDVAYLARFTFGGHARAIWRSKLDGLRGLPRAWQRRQQIQAVRRATPQELRQKMDRGWLSPYLPSVQLRLARLRGRRGAGG